MPEDEFVFAPKGAIAPDTDLFTCPYHGAQVNTFTMHPSNTPAKNLIKVSQSVIHCCPRCIYEKFLALGIYCEEK